VPRRGRLPTDQLEPYLLDMPHPRTPPAPLAEWLARVPPAVLDWAALFGNGHPVEIEAGFGKGLFLLNASRRRPTVNFLGVEIERKYVLLTADRVARRGIAWHVPMPIGCCAIASPAIRCPRFMSISPTRGGKNGIASVACSRRNSPINARACCGRSACCISSPMSKNISQRRMPCCSPWAPGATSPGRSRL
jgi:hypothetical protein